MRDRVEVSGLMCDDDARRELSGEPVVYLLPLEPREHPVRRGGGDELPPREKREVRPDRARRRPVVLGVVERDVEIADAGFLERRVDVRAAEDAPEREG